MAVFHHQKSRRIFSSMLMLSLVLTQFSTGVFPIPLEPISEEKVEAADPCPDIQNTATVSASNHTTITTNTVTTTTNCPEPRLEITKKTSTNNAEPGDTVTFTLAVKNTGTGTAKNVVISDVIPTGLTFNDSASSSACNSNGSVVTCGPLNLDGGKEQTYTLKFDVGSTAPCNGNIYNTASALADNHTTVSSNQVSISITCPNPELTLTKSADKTTISPQDTVTYSLVVRNNGNAVANNVKVIDPISPYYTYLDAISDNLCNQVGNTVECGTFSLNPGASKTLKVAFKLLDTSPPCNQQIENTAEGEADGNIRIWSNKVYVNVQCPQPDIRVRKDVDATSLSGGKGTKRLTYTITVENPGQVSLTNVHVLDTIPSSSLTFIPGASDSSCQQSGNRVECTKSSLSVGQQKEFVLAFDVDTDTACNEIIRNNATVNSDQLGSKETNTVTTTVSTCPQPRLSAIKTAQHTTREPGDQIRFTIAIFNDGDGDATGVTLTDTVPNGLTYVSGLSPNECKLSGNTITCGNYSISAHDSKYVSLYFTVNANAPCDSTIVNRGTIAASNHSTVSTNDESITVICPNTQLKIQKGVDVSVAKYNDIITYTLNVENVGTTSATNVVVSDVVPQYLTYLDNQSDSSCDLNGGTVICDGFNLSAGRDKTIQLKFSLLDSAPCDIVIPNTASAKADNATGVQSAQVHFRVECLQPNFTTEKTVNKSQAEIGDALQYDIKVTNTGKVPLSGLSVIDSVPAGLTFNASASDNRCFLQGGDIKCSSSTIAVGGSETYTLVFTVRNDAQCNSTIYNQGYVVATGNGNLDRYTNTVYTTVVCPKTELRLTKIADKTTATRSDLVTYTLTVKNTGNVTAENVTVSDGVPAYLTYLDSQSDSSCDLNGSTVECDGFNLSAGQSKELKLVFKVLDTAPCNGVIVNRADAYAKNAPTVWSSQVNTSVYCPVPALTAKKTVNKTSVEHGDQLSYDITVQNTGEVTLKSLWIIDTIPAGLTFNASASDNRCFLQGGDIKCGYNDIPVGSSDTYTIAFTVKNDAQCGNAILNQAYVVATGNNNLDGYTNTVSTTVTCKTPGIEIRKAVDKTFISGNLNLPHLTYSIALKNTGNTTLTDVVITDHIPDHLTLVPSSTDSDCHKVLGDIVCDGTDIPSGQTNSYTIVFAVDVEELCGQTIRNVATVDTYELPRTTSNTVDTVVGSCPEPDLYIEKTATPYNVTRGQQFVYKLFVENQGLGKAKNVIASDVLPTEVTFVPNASSPECSLSGNKVQCGPLDLDTGDDKLYTIAVTTKSDAPCTQFFNQASVSASNANPKTSASVGVTVQCATSFTAQKVVSSNTVERGNTLSYDIKVTNTGQLPLTGISVVDTVPTGLTFNQAASDNRCFLQGGDITCSSNTIAVGSSDTYTIVFTVKDTAQCSSTITNKAYVVATGNNNLDGYTNTVSTNVICPNTELQLTKIADTAVAKHDDIVTYTLNVKNIGTVTAKNVTVADAIPPYLTYLDNQSDSSCDLNGSTVECDGFNLAAGQSKELKLVFKVLDTAPCNGVIVNRADAYADNAATVWSSQVNVRVECANPEFTATKTVNTSSVKPGEKLSYDIVVKNTSQVTLGGLWVIDTVPSQLTFDDAASDTRCFLQGGDIKCGDDDIAVGGSDTYTIVFTVKDTAQCSSTITNKAYVVATGNSNLDGYTNTVSTNVICDVPKLKLTKSANVDTAYIGDVIKYNLVVENIGEGRAYNVFVVDDVIPELAFLSTQSSPECVLNGNTVECGPVDLNKNAKKQFTIAFTVNSYAQCNSTIYNQAEAVASNATSVLSNSESVEILCPDPKADVQVIKSGVGQIMRGTTIVYDINVKNLGPDTAEDVLIYDIVPQVLKQDSSTYINLAFNPFESDGSCSEIAGEVVCGGIDLLNGNSRTFKVAFDVPPNAFCAKPILNHVEVETATDDPVSANNADDHYATVNCATGTLDIHKDGPATAKHGDEITYTVTVENNLGYSVTKNRVIDPVPANLQYIRSDDSLCRYQSQTNEVICGEFDLATNQSRTFTMTFKVLDSALCGRAIINIADIWSNHGGVNPEWSNAVDTTILCDAKLLISKTDNRTTAKVGDTLTYEIDVRNISQTNATNVVVVDDLPSEVTFLSTSANGTYNQSNHSVTWTIDVQANDTKTLTITAKVASGDDGDIVRNEVCIEGTSTCDDDTTTIIEEQKPVLTIAKTDHRSTVQPGQQLTYDIDIANISSTYASDVVVIDTLPSFVSFVSASHNGTFSNGAVEWKLDVGAHATETRNVTVQVNQNAPDGTYLLNFVEIVGGPDDDDTTKVIVEQEQLGCIDVKKETFNTNGATLTPVTQFAFALDGNVQTIYNDSTGNAKFTNVPVGTHTVTETIPSGWKQLSVTPSNGQVVVPEGSNCVTVTFKNQQVGTTTEEKDFTISKTDNETEVRPGERLTYEITVKNVGNVDATDVEVIDDLPGNVDYVSSSDGGSRSGSRVTWSIDLNAGQSKTLTVKVDVDDNADDGDRIDNEACVENYDCDDDRTTVVDNNNSDGDIRISVNGDPDPVDLCREDYVEYDIRLTNSSDSSERVDVIALLDSNTDYQSSSDGGRERSTDRVEWDNISISRNSSKTLRLRVRVESGTRDGDTLRLRVAVSDGDTDSETTRVVNRCDNPPPPQYGAPELTIDKTADRTEALAGSLVSYTITIRNTGNEDLPNTVLTDDYPETYMTISDPGGGADAGGTLRWDLGTLRANSTTVVRYRVRLKEGLPRGTTIRNIATVRGGALTRTDDHVIVVPTPPQTGLGAFISGVSDNQKNITQVASENAAGATLPILVWVTTMLTGLGLGGFLGKRFLF